MKLVSIPNFEEYRLDAIFDCYKWDPQFKDSNTLSNYALVLSEKEYKEIKNLTEKLDKETIQKCIEELGVPVTIRGEALNLEQFAQLSNIVGKYL